MKRKITKMGPASLVVSLPSKWVKENNIVKGDEVEVEEQGKRLSLSLGKKNEKENKAILDCKIYEPILERYMSILYKKGYDEIKVLTYTPRQKMKAINYVSQLVGFEIVEQKENELTLRNISKDNPDEFEVVVKRIFHTLISAAEETGQALKENNKEQLKASLSYEQLSNKLTDYCKRLLFRYITDEKSILQYTIVRDLEMIADEYKFIAQHYSGKHTFDKKLSPLYTKVTKYVKSLYTLYYKQDVVLLSSFTEERRKLIKILLLALEKEKFPNTKILQNLIGIVQRTFDLNVPIATLAVQDTLLEK